MAEYEFSRDVQRIVDNSDKSMILPKSDNWRREPRDPYSGRWLSTEHDEEFGDPNRHGRPLAGAAKKASIQKTIKNYEELMVAAKLKGYAARKSGDTAAYEDAVHALDFYRREIEKLQEQLRKFG